jgi:hypothetical protein
MMSTWFNSWFPLETGMVFTAISGGLYTELSIRFGASARGFAPGHDRAIFSPCVLSHGSCIHPTGTLGHMRVTVVIFTYNSAAGHTDLFLHTWPVNCILFSVQNTCCISHNLIIFTVLSVRRIEDKMLLASRGPASERVCSSKTRGARSTTTQHGATGRSATGSIHIHSPPC